MLMLFNQPVNLYADDRYTDTGQPGRRGRPAIGLFGTGQPLSS
jgi:hypothetical protein